jgi:hypothetical protein
LSTTSDIAKIVANCRKFLDLDSLALPDEYRYAGLPHCVLDAVFSIGVRYESTRKVVIRYCERRKIVRIRPSAALPPRDTQEPLSKFIGYVDSKGSARFARYIVANLQRTSTKAGILKAEAARLFAEVLQSFKVEYLQDLKTVENDNTLDRDLRSIPGMSSGIAIQYFWMLAGSDHLIKPDRMVLRFIESAIGRPFHSTAQAGTLVRAVVKVLNETYPHLTPRLLDYGIWSHQRRQG